MGRRKKQFSVKLVEYKYPSGSPAYKVVGNFNFSRIRRNFPTREEAEAFLNALKAHAGKSDNIHQVFTRLTEDQVRDAEGARAYLDSLKLHSVSLSSVVYQYVEQYQPVTDIEVWRAVDEFQEACRRRGNRPSTISVNGYALKGLLRHPETKLEYSLSDVSIEQLKNRVYEGGKTARTHRDRRGLLLNFYNWAVRQGYAEYNPIDIFERPKVRKDLPGILEIDQCEKLIHEATELYGGKMLPYFSVCLFSGVRPTEFTRLNSWDSFDLEEHKHIEVSELVSKTNSRLVPISDNLAEILEFCVVCGDEIEPGFFSRRMFNAVREKAGINFPWKGPFNDVLRHTYASHHYAAYKDMNWLCHAMGNSPEVLRRDYLRPVPLKTGRRFFEVGKV